MDPLVSVLIPCFHAHNDLPVALASLGRQHYGHLEAIIISDDGSDYSKAVGEQPFPVHYASTGGVATGPANAKNIGRERSSGEVVVILDSDDMLNEDFIERIVPIVMAKGACVTPRLPVDYQTYAPLPARGASKLAEYSTRDHLTIREYLHMPFGWQTVYRRNMLDVDWDRDLFLDQDWVLECILFERIGYAPFNPYQGYRYRVRSGSICHADNSHERIFKEYPYMIERLQDAADRLGLTTETAMQMIPVLESRMEAVRRYRADTAAGRAAYEPLLIVDLVHYPN